MGKFHPDIARALETPDAQVQWSNRPGRTAPSIRERLIANTERITSGCLIKKYKIHRTYPIISIANRSVQASAVVFYLEHGYRPTVVRHTCDNAMCLEVSHLVGGSYADNTNDIRERGQLGHMPWTHCKQGHELTDDNRYPNGSGCKLCGRQRSLNRYYANRLATRQGEDRQNEST